ncbi:hypothetical protein VF673_11480 [Halopseudomonas sp. Lyrl_26]|uniref:hypothetical protein n=1 Tax=Halopseudomonas sp. Lyrl_26 TaxID=3110923 RepID=UPI003F7F219C
MRLIYLGIPLMAVMLAACGDDERDDRVHEEPIPTTTDEYNTTPGSAPMDTPPANGTGGSMGSGNSPGTGTSTQPGMDGQTAPGTGTGTGTGTTGSGSGTGTSTQ